MWDLFRSKAAVCPVEPDEQRWIDGRFQWLQERLGRDIPTSVQVILPTPEFFPDPFDARPDDLPPMFRRIAHYMRVDPDRFTVFLYDEGNPAMVGGAWMGSTSGSAGLYLHPSGDRSSGDRVGIGIEIGQLRDPSSLVATIAHEIGHDILIGQGHVTAQQQDHEPLTDLLTVFMGMGIFTGNSTIRDRGWSDGVMSGWKTSRHGYLSQRMLGYALARFAFVRGERNPQWLSHARPDIQSPLKAGLRFLESAHEPPKGGRR
jgi:hypothetical protein